MVKIEKSIHGAVCSDESEHGTPNYDVNSHDVSGMVIRDLGIGTGASGTTICVDNTLIRHIAKEISDFRRRKIRIEVKTPYLRYFLGFQTDF